MFANRIRELRQAQDMAPMELAYRIGRATNTLWRYEMNETQPPLGTAVRIASVLGCTLDDLFVNETKQEAA